MNNKKQRKRALVGEPWKKYKKVMPQKKHKISLRHKIQLTVVVRKLNKIFNINHYSGKQHKPFFGAITNEGEYFIVCLDHYTYTDDKRFKVLKKRFSKEFEFLFSTNIKLLNNIQIKVR